jgi:uncharacterized protein (TIGR03437 family)
VSVARLQRRPPGPNYFYARATAPFEAAAEQGACSTTQQWLDRPATLSSSREPLSWWFSICDSPASEHQLNVNSASSFRLDAASGGSQPGAMSLAGQGQSAFRLTTRDPWRLAPQSVELDRQLAPLNAANMQPQLAPGSLMSVFGSGLLAPDGRVSITVDGLPLAPVGQSPFKLTFWLPPGLQPGRHPARIANALGQVEFEVEVLPAAPAVFQDQTGLPLITNTGGRTITPLEPAARGSDILVYATGLGELNGTQSSNPVGAAIDGRPAAVVSVDWVPEQAGVYRVRVTIPQGQAPGESLALSLTQGGVSSFPVRLSVR